MRILAISFLLVWGTLIGAGGLFAQSPVAEYESGRLFIKVRQEINKELPIFRNAESLDHITGFPVLKEMLQRYGATEVSKPFKTQTVAIQKIYHIYFEATDRTEGLIRELNSLSYLEFAEKVPVYHTTHNPNDLGIDQWGLNKIQPWDAWDISFGSESIVVAVVDDAVMMTHEDLASEIWTNADEIPNNGIDDDNNGYIDDVNGFDLAHDDNDPSPPNFGFSHGTHVAGIAGATTNNNKGVASIGYRVKIMPVKVKEDTTSGAGLQATAEGVDYAIANVADVVNMSYGGSGFSFAYQTLINEGHNLGMTFVAAAGNDNQHVQSFPAAYDHVISVASTGIFDAKSGFSNYHQSVDVSAPGSGILSTVPGNGGNDYSNFSGTSMASPMTAGLCALILSVDSTLTPDEVESCLESGCENIDAFNSQYLGRMGAGRLNAHNTLLCLSATSRELDEKLNWKGFVMGQVYPNPAQEAVSFAGSFSKRGILTISLTDALGRTISTLYKGQVVEGPFYAETSVPENLQMGTYFAVWEFEGERKAQRIAILK